MKIIQFFVIMLIVQLFYGFGITALSYAVCDTQNVPDAPVAACPYFTGFSDVGGNVDLADIGREVQNSLESQTNIPVIELGALVFYSGNIFLDLLLNFLTAVPQMLTLLINGLMLLFSVDPNLFSIVEVFSSVLFTVLYAVGLITLLLNIRSGQVIT